MSDRQAPAAPRVHTLDAAAAILGGSVKASWLREMARQRKIPFTFLGGAYHFTDAHLDEIVQIFEQRPAPRTASRAPARRAASPADGTQDAPVLNFRTPRRRRSAA